jgi:hypothetical protein
MEDKPADPEVILRELAAGRIQEFARAPNEAKARIHRAAWDYLMGAAEALEAMRVIDPQRGFALVQEILDSSTEELVADGQLARVAMRVVQQESAVPRHDPLDSMTAALTQLRELGIISETEYRDLRSRTELRYPPENDS